MSLWIWEMRALLLAGDSDLPRLLILSRSVGTLVARLGRREARRMQRETRGPDCAKTRKRSAPATLWDDQTLLQCCCIFKFTRLDLGPREPHCLASVPQIWFLLGCVSNHVGQGNKMRLPLVLIHNFIYIHNLHTWFEIHNKNVLDTSTAVWSKWNMTLFDTTSPEEAAEMQAFCADFEKAFKS